MNTNNNNNNMKDTGPIVAFHIGPGGRYHNEGFKTYAGRDTVKDILIMRESRRNTFIQPANVADIRRMLERRELPNVMSLLERCHDADDYTAFEQRTGISVGEDVYVDANEAEIITVEQANTGTGMLDWDGGYDTDIAKHLSECDERELKLIAEHDEDLIEEWCEMMDVVVDWKRFNGDYMGLIEDIHNSSKIDVEYYYREVEPDVERLGKK